MLFLRLLFDTTLIPGEPGPHQGYKGHGALPDTSLRGDGGKLLSGIWARKAVTVSVGQRAGPSP